MIRTLTLLSLLVAITISLSSQSQQIQQPLSANFQGSFDSTQPFNTEYPTDEVQMDREATYEQQQQDMLEFAQHLGDYIPDQTFTIRLLPFQSFAFFLWPGAAAQSIRGMFHCQISMNIHEDYDTGEYLDLTILDGASVVREFKKQRLGVFNHPHNLKDHKYYFHFTSHDAPIDIYFSYEKVASAKKNPKTQSNETEVYKVSQKYSQINKLLEQQEKEMVRLIEMGDRHTHRIRNHLNELYWRGVAEGILIVGSALVSLGMLKRQIYKQYQSLV